MLRSQLVKETYHPPRNVGLGPGETIPIETRTELSFYKHKGCMMCNMMQRFLTVGPGDPRRVTATTDRCEAFLRARHAIVKYSISYPSTTSQHTDATAEMNSGTLRKHMPVRRRAGNQHPDLADERSLAEGGRGRVTYSSNATFGLRFEPGSSRAHQKTGKLVQWHVQPSAVLIDHYDPPRDKNC